MPQRSRPRPYPQPAWWLWLAALASLSAPSVRAQALPDAGALLRETQRDAPQAPSRPAPSAPGRAAEPAPPGSEIRFSVKAFRLDGRTLLPEAVLQAALAPWLNRPIGFGDLELAGDALLEAYRRAGFYVRVQLPPQDIDAGTVAFQLIEARLGAVSLDSASARVDPAFVIGMVTARQRAGAPLDAAALDRAAALLADTPGLQAGITLLPGRAAGETDLRVSVKDAPRWSGLVQADDHGARSTGAWRRGGLLSLDGPGGVGDQAVLGSSLSAGSRYARLAWSRPAGHDGLRLGIEGSLLSYRLQGEFSVLDARGTAQTLALTAQYPIVRAPQRNLLLDTRLEQRFYRDEANSAETDRKRLSTFSLALGGDLADGLGGAGSTLWGISLVAGHVDLSGHAENEAADRAGPHTRGRFGKLAWRLGRAQQLAGDGTTLWLSLNGQFATRNLDSSEKLSLGGAYGVRAYPALEGSGDSGAVATLEVRQALGPRWQAIGFIDAGHVRRDHDAGYAGAPSPQSVALKGYGFGLGYGRAGDFSIRANIAARLGSNPLGQADGANSDGSRGSVRGWILAVMTF